METEKRNDVSNGEDEDEQKMEQFYALIRNFQEARNKRKNELKQKEAISEEKKKQKKETKLDVDEQFTSWVPTFEWADFTEEIEFRRPPVIFPSPNNKKEDKKLQREDAGFDLKLTL